MSDVLADADPPSAAPGMSARVRMWGAVIVSAGTVVGFTAAVLVVLCRPIPAGSDAIVNALLGTLGTLTTGVVNYWIGSSAGSAAKDARR